MNANIAILAASITWLAIGSLSTIALFCICKYYSIDIEDDVDEESQYIREVRQRQQVAARRYMDETDARVEEAACRMGYGLNDQEAVEIIAEYVCYGGGDTEEEHDRWRLYRDLLRLKRQRVGSE